MQAVQKLVTDDSSSPITLSAIGIGLLSLATMLGVRLQRGLQPVAIRASSGGLGPLMPMNTASALGDNVMEMKYQDPKINYNAAVLATRSAHKVKSNRVGWGQLPSQNSCSRTAPLCTALPPVQVAAADDPLFQLVNEFIYEQSGFYSPADESAFSDEFVFRGPIIGPLTKVDYLKTLDFFRIYEAVPDISPNAWGFSKDPLDPNRVWFMVRNSGTFSGKALNVVKGFTVPSNGAELRGCPETFSITFDESRKVKYLTVGYVADRFEGNTNGKGAAAGILELAGISLPSTGPVLGLSNWMTNELVDIGARTYSSENVPSWWTNTLRAAEGYP
jgi:hypothetical protein